MQFAGSGSLLGFWSYSRAVEELSRVLHEAMEANLNEHLAPICRVEIFRDKEIGHGHHWPRTLVRKIAGSALFFWVQSPRWLKSEICRFELEMFCAQIERIARRFSTPTAPIDPDRLLDRLLIPVRWINMEKRLWDSLPSDAVSRFRPLWRDTNVRDELKLANANPSRHELLARCLAIGEALRADLFAALPDNVDLRELIGFLATEDRGFLDEWISRFPHGGLNAAPRTPPMPARRQDHAGLGLSFFLVPADTSGAPGFWANTEPLGGDVARRVRRQLPPDQQPRSALNGHLLWPAEAAAVIAAALRPAGADLPDFAQGAALAALFELDPETRRQLGWQSPVANFWCRAADGSVFHAGASAAFLPLLVVMPTN